MATPILVIAIFVGMANENKQWGAPLMYGSIFVLAGMHFF